MKRPLKLERNWGALQFVAAFITALMLAADFYTLRDLFLEIVDIARDAYIYSMVLACALEGLPFYLGTIVSEVKDEGCYYKNDRKVARFGCVITLVALLLVFAMAAGLRAMFIQNQYLQGAYSQRRGFEQMIPQLFLMVSPILTSTLAFVASWFAFRRSYLEELYRKVIRKQNIYLRCKSAFQKAYNPYMRARHSLWASLADPDCQMPVKSTDYRRECFAHIRSKLVTNCIVSYPTQIEQYTQRVNQALEECLLEMSKHTTLPHAITDISLADLIEEYDNRAMDAADCWNYNYAGPDLEAELRNTLDNAIVVAHFETVVGQYQKRKKVNL